MIHIIIYLLRGSCSSQLLHKTSWSQDFVKMEKWEGQIICFWRLKRKVVNPVCSLSFKDFGCRHNEASKVVDILQKMAERNILPDASVISSVTDILSQYANYLEYLTQTLNFHPSAESKIRCCRHELQPVTNVKDVSSLDKSKPGTQKHICWCSKIGLSLGNCNKSTFPTTNFVV